MMTMTMIACTRVMGMGGNGVFGVQCWMNKIWFDPITKIWSYDPMVLAH
jgi:hypothetical protein